MPEWLSRVEPPRRGEGRRRRRRCGPAAAGVPDVDVGRCLRQLREARGLSIRALAEKSGLAINTLSLIENGKTSPSVSTLQQLAVALEAPITAFFEAGQTKESVVYSRATGRRRTSFERGWLEDLGAGLAGCTLEPCVITLEPGAGSRPQPVVHTGHELVFCLEGRIAYTIGARTYLLEPGDSLLFESQLPHRWQNVDDQPSRVVLVLCPSDERDRPTERHFALDRWR